MTSKILLYYKFQPVADPDAVRLWQRDLCEGLGLKGRIIVSKDGINGTVGGDIRACKTYAKKTREYFKDMEFKWSDGSADDFPKLSVKARDEIVAFGAPGELKVDERGVVGGGEHLTPRQVNELVAEKPDAVFFDGRNAREAEIGHFKGAVVPDVETTHDFIKELDSGKYDWMKDKPVISYCTGGIRCEVLTPLMKSRGFGEVYQIDGGIVRYGEKYGNSGLWEGSLYVFDKRMHTEFGAPGDPDYVQVGHCVHCGADTNQFYNCANEPQCRHQYLSCEACRERMPYCADCASNATMPTVMTSHSMVNGTMGSQNTPIHGTHRS